MRHTKPSPDRRRQHGQRGTALIFALVVVFVLSIGTSVLWKQLHANLNEQRRTWHREQAFQLAEAGLEHAIARLRTNPAGYTGETDVPLGAGAFSVQVTRPTGADTYVLESWGRLNQNTGIHDRAGLRARLRLDAGGAVAEYAWEPIRGNAP
jgi:Tfp pilus assembly protein PilX